jgi:hypothetical protein
VPDLALSLERLGVVKEALEGKKKEKEKGSIGVGDLFREDLEQTRIARPPDNYDVSNHGPLRGGALHVESSLPVAHNL